MTNENMNHTDYTVERDANISVANLATTNAETISSAISELQLAGTVSCINRDLTPEWSPWTGSNKCPKCGSPNIEVNDTVVLTSNPPQSQLRCKECGYYFSSRWPATDDTSDATDKRWQHDQSILNIPKVGDWPPGPQVGDWPPYNDPDYPEPPSYPDVYIPRKDSPMGWICPKCGRCYAPHVSSCSHCNGSSIKITY